VKNIEKLRAYFLTLQTLHLIIAWREVLFKLI